MECKRELRAAILETRDALPAAKISARSARAGDLLFALPEIATARLILFFVSFESEIATVPMIVRALAAGIRVAAPRVARGARQLVPHEVRHLPSDLAPGEYGIPEPKPHLPVVPLDEIDVVIVPAVVWSEEGFRVGYGAGYYDRLLPAVPRAARVGLGFELQVRPEVPQGPHDLPVDVLVTEERVRRFARAR